MPRAKDYCRKVLSQLLDEIEAEHDAQPAARLLTAAELAFPNVSADLVASVLVQLAGRGRATAREIAREIAAEVIRLARIGQQQEKQAARQRDFLRRANDRADLLFREVEWPPERHDRASDLHRFIPLRGSDGDHWFSEKLAREVSYDSLLKLSIIQILDRSSKVVGFCEQPLNIEYELDGRRRRYYPDLLVLTEDGSVVLIEIKPLTDVGPTINRAKFAAARKFCHDQGWGFLVTDGYRSFRHVAERRVSPEVEARLRQELTRGTLYWPNVLQLRKELDIHSLDIPALAVQESWDMRLEPYRLSIP